MGILYWLGSSKRAKVVGWTLSLYLCYAASNVVNETVNEALGKAEVVIRYALPLRLAEINLFPIPNRSLLSLGLKRTLIADPNDGIESKLSE